MPETSPFFLAAAPADERSGSLQARWDPNSPGCVGISHDDGTFRYYLPDGGCKCFQLFTAAQLAPFDADPWSKIQHRPAPVSATWSHWSFVPGQPGTLLFSQRDSDQLLQTSMPADAGGTHPDSRDVGIGSTTQPGVWDTTPRGR